VNSKPSMTIRAGASLLQPRITETTPAGGLEAGWRIVARRGWRFGGLAARGQYRRAPETMMKRESLLLQQCIQAEYAVMPVGHCAGSGGWVIIQPIHQLAVLEELSGVRTQVMDPSLDFIQLQQPGEVNTAF